MNKTGIEWCDYSWNPIKGCSPVSEGCENCYAAGMAHRFKQPWGRPVFRPELLEEPFRLRKPSRIFVCSVSDIFHPGVDTGAIVAILDTVRRCPQHTFIFLTKRPQRLHERQLVLPGDRTEPLGAWFNMPNIWIGVTAENQARADERIPVLLSIPAAVRFVSVEPMLGPVNLCALNDGSWYDAEGADLYDAIRGTAYWRNGDHGLSGGHLLDWVICGPETGPKARPCDPAWIYQLADQSPCFFDKRACWTRREWPK